MSVQYGRIARALLLAGGITTAIALPAISGTPLMPSASGAGSNVVLAVNVAASDIEDPHFVKDIVKIVREADFPPAQLEIEVTESVAMRNAEIVRERISLLRKLGIRFAMDDFGAGYSNLSTMARLPGMPLVCVPSASTCPLASVRR